MTILTCDSQSTLAIGGRSRVCCVRDSFVVTYCMPLLVTRPFAIAGHIKTVLMNIKDDFEKVIRLMPEDTTVDPAALCDPSASGILTVWRLMRCPWQDMTEEEGKLPFTDDVDCPSYVIAGYQKAILSKWFHKETLATCIKRCRSGGKCHEWQWQKQQLL